MNNFLLNLHSIASKPTYITYITRLSQIITIIEDKLLVNSRLITIEHSLFQSVC